MVPGTTMTYAGIPDAGERADLIAYLREAGRSPQCRAR
jgi:cytochrome c